MQVIRQGATQLIMFGPFVDKTDGVTLKTDATTITDIDHATTGIFVSKNGAAAAVRHQNVTASVADAYGMMKVTLDATDTGTVGTLDVLFAKAATYLPVHKSCQVIDTVVYDALFKDAAIGELQGVILGATQTGVTIPTVTTVTNQVTAAQNATAVWQDTTAADFTLASSVGKSVMNGVTLGTGLTVNDLTTKSGFALSSTSVTAIWAEVMTGTTTAVQAMRGFLAAILGKASGLPTAPVYRNVADGKDVITAVTDADGNRTSVTLDLT